MQVAGCVQAVVGEKNFLVQFKDRKKKEMGSCLITSVCSEYEVVHEVNEPISELLKKEGELLTIDDNPVDGG